MDSNSIRGGNIGLEKKKRSGENRREIPEVSFWGGQQNSRIRDERREGKDEG